MKNNVKDMIALRNKIDILEEELDAKGQETFGYSYAGCFMDYQEDVFVVEEDCGHDSEFDKRWFNKQGEED